MNRIWRTALLLSLINAGAPAAIPEQIGGWAEGTDPSTAGQGARQGSYDLQWWTVDSGGGLSQGGVYAVAGTVGQPDAGSSTGGVFDLTGGFWGGAGVPLIFADGFEGGDSARWSDTTP